jgi:hypothetical protein
MCCHEDGALMGAEVSMTPASVPDLLTVMEAAGVLRVGRTTAYDAHRQHPCLGVPRAELLQVNTSRRGRSPLSR